MGAVTSTVRFLLNSITLEQVKAETSSFITLVLTYLSTHCSVCVEDLDSQGSNAGRGIWMGWGEYSKPVPAHILAVWFTNPSGSPSVRLSVLINFIPSTHMCTHLNPICSPKLVLFPQWLQTLPALQNFHCLFLREKLSNSSFYCQCSFASLLWTFSSSQLSSRGEGRCRIGTSLDHPLQFQGPIESPDFSCQLGFWRQRSNNL